MTATNPVGTASVASAPSAPVVHDPPAAVPGSPPAIAGPAKAGQVLTASTGGWIGDGLEFDYQWQRCDTDGTHCVDIGGATGETYTPTGPDVGKVVRVAVTASNDTGTETRTSEPTGPIAPAPVATPAANPTGTPTGGARHGPLGDRRPDRRRRSRASPTPPSSPCRAASSRPRAASSWPAARATAA